MANAEPMEAAKKIVESFEDIFGDLTLTEGDWLARKIAAEIERHATLVTKQERLPDNFLDIA